MGREATPRGCLRLGPGLTGRDQWALLRGAARSLRAERRPREVLEESAACTVTAALIPGAGLERGRGEKGREQPGRGARGGERERAGAGGAHRPARARAQLSCTLSSLPRFFSLASPQRLPQSPAVAHPAPALRARRTSGVSMLSPAKALLWPSADLVPCSRDWSGLAWTAWAPLLPLPGQSDNEGFVPTAGEG